METQIYTYTERFTKNDIDKQGYKLAFCDTNVISDYCSNPCTQEKINTYFKDKKLRLVLTNFLIAEMLQGLYTFSDSDKDIMSNYFKKNNSSAPYDDLLQNLPSPQYNYQYVEKKKSIMKFLHDKLNPLWILPTESIRTLEYLNCQSTIDAHQSLKILSNHPLEIMRNTKIVGSRSYECDKFLNYCFNTYESIVNNQGCLMSYLEDIIANPDYTTTFEIGKAANVQAMNELRSKNLKKNKLETYLIKQDLQYNTNTATNDTSITKIRELIENQSPSSFKIAPFCKIEDKISYDIEWKTGTYNKSKVDKNNFLDHQHIEIALSYCDYFITNDLDAQDKANTIKSDLGIQVIVTKPIFS